MRGRATAVVAAAVALLVWWPAPAASASHPPHRPPVVLPVVTDATVCDQTLWAVYTTQVLEGRHLVTRVDDGLVSLQVLEVSGRSGPDGWWETVHAVPGGEGRLRWLGYGRSTAEGSHWRLVRVARADSDGIVSAPVGIREGCEA